MKVISRLNTRAIVILLEGFRRVFTVTYRVKVRARKKMEMARTTLAGLSQAAISSEVLTSCKTLKLLE